MSDANQVRTGYVFETTEGTTPPDSANWQTARIVSDGIDAVPEFVQSDEIVSDRLRIDQRKVGDTISGAVVCRLSEDTLDAWLEALMQGTWTGDVLKAGTTKRSITWERWFQDADFYQWFKGVQLNSMDITFGRELITVTFNVMGMSSGTAGTGQSLVGAGTIAAATSTEILAGIDTSSIEVDGTESALDIAGITLSLNNNMYPIYDLRAAGAGGHGSGFSDVSGTFDAYLADASLRAKLDNQTNFDLAFQVTIGAKSFHFDMQTSKLSAAPITIPGGNQAIIQNCQFNVFKDATTGSNLTITRVT